MSKLCVLSFFFCSKMLDNLVTNPYGHTQYHNQIMYNHIHMIRPKHAQAINYTEPNNIQSIIDTNWTQYTQQLLAPIKTNRYWMIRMMMTI